MSDIPKPLLRIDIDDPVTAGVLIDFLNTLKVDRPDRTLVTIDPLGTESERQEQLASISKRLSELTDSSEAPDDH